MRVYEALVEEFVRQGVRQVFGLMGEDTAKLLALLPASGISYLSGRHESSAVGMADGYARLSGAVGVAVLSRGCGFTNAMTALTTAARGGSRVLVLAADTADTVPKFPSVTQTARLSHKYVDQRGALDAIGLPHVALHNAVTAASDLGGVFERVRAGVTMVVNVAMDLLNANTDAGERPAGRGVELPVMTAPLAPDPEQIKEVADLLETTWASSYPVILAGRGAVRSNAADDLQLLGAQTGALMTTTLPARSMFRGDPFDAGIMGTFSTPVTVELLGHADVLLAFGASLNLLTTYGNELCPRARLVHIDADSSAFGRFVETTLVVSGDVKLSAAALRAELLRRGHTHGGYRTEAVARQLASSDPAVGVRDQSDDRGLDPRILMRALNDVLPRDRVLVVDPGHHLAFQVPYIDVLDPGSFVLPLDFGAIGTGTPLAIGAAIAQQERLTVLGAGDGGFMMTLGELDTAIRAGVPLLILVFNDSAYGAEVHCLDVHGLPTELARFAERSFDAIAAAMGADSMSVRSLDDVKHLKRRLDKGLHGVLLVDCRITTAVRADFVNSMSLITGQPAK
jgi:acetolactate synthase I/II/III large subunit